MKSRLALFTICIIAMLAIAGCKGSGSGGSLFSNISDSISHVSSGGSGTGDGDASAIDTGNTADIGHTPEPATIVLLGGGLAALAFLARRKRK